MSINQGTRIPIEVVEAPILDPRAPVWELGERRPASLPALTSVRFLAALQVVLFHLTPSTYRHQGPLSAVLGCGYMGVSFFFVLSGFILTYAHGAQYQAGRPALRRFYFARFARIYPLYFVCMVVAFAVAWRLLMQPRHVLVAMIDLAMLQSWSIHTVGFFLVPAWTLPCEALFYAIFPFLLLPLRPRTRGQGVLWITGFWMLAGLAPLVFFLHSYGLHWEPWTQNMPPGNTAFAITRLPLYMVPEFLAGVVAGWLLLRLGPTTRQGLWLTISGFAIVAACTLGSEHLPALMLYNGLLIPAYVMLMIGLSRPHWITHLLSWAPLVLLGEASYALYLTHQLLGGWLTDHLGIAFTLRSEWWKVPIMVALSIAVHLLWERPARGWLLRWSKQRPWGRADVLPGTTAPRY